MSQVPRSRLGRLPLQIKSKAPPCHCTSPSFPTLSNHANGHDAWTSITSSLEFVKARTADAQDGCAPVSVLFNSQRASVETETSQLTQLVAYDAERQGQALSLQTAENGGDGATSISSGVTRLVLTPSASTNNITNAISTVFANSPLEHEEESQVQAACSFFKSPVRFDRSHSQEQSFGHDPFNSPSLEWTDYAEYAGQEDE
jgi:hypothetical protein